MSISHWGVFPGVLYRRRFGWITVSSWRPLSFDFWCVSNV